jgi:hypothetical protein
LKIGVVLDGSAFSDSSLTLIQEEARERSLYQVMAIASSHPYAPILPFAQTGERSLESGGISSVRFSQLGKFIALSTSDDTFFIFETGNIEPLAQFPPVDGPINDSCWDSCVSSVYTVTKSGSV